MIIFNIKKQFVNKLAGEGMRLFTFARDAVRKTNIFDVPEAELMVNGSCGVRKWGVASSPSSVSQSYKT